MEHESTSGAVSPETFLASLGAASQAVKSLFDDIPGVHFFLKDRESRFTGASESFVRLMGQSRVDQLIGKTDHDFSPDFIADVFYEDDQNVIRSGKPIHSKVELVPTGTGSLDWLCTSKVPLRDAVGAIIGLAGITRIIRDSESVYADHPEMQKAVQYVREHYKEKIVIADIAKSAGVSVSSLERLFRKLFGLTPLMYVRKARLNAACHLLRDTDTDLPKIAVDCGFNDQTNMTRAFRLELRITPFRYRRRFKNRPKKRGRTPSEDRLHVAI